jgi:aminopeptidase-like protein
MRLVRLLEQEISGQSARNACAILSTYHRIQASPGYKEAAQFCLRELDINGIETELLEFPAKIGEQFWALKSFEFWSIRSARLQAILPNGRRLTLANFREHPLSVIQRSKSTPLEGVIAAVVDLGHGEDAKDYEGIDVKGKFILCTGDVGIVQRLACEQHGAIGIIKESIFGTDLQRQPSLETALKYASFWWERPDPKSLGFIISPSQAQWLRNTIEDGTEEVKLQAFVDAEFREGTIDIVTAKIPGQTDNEIILTSHLCHPAPGADDNASGVAVGIETMSALANLIRKGELPKPRRTIRLILLPETTGSYAYLSYRDKQGTLEQMLAGLNVDMVGQDQNKCGGAFIVELAPDACFSFVNILLKTFFQLLSQESRKFSGYKDFPLFRWSNAPFEDGSDNYVFCDPTINVPCPGLIQWPSRFYHSSEDTIDHIDPLSLWRSAVLSGLYIYFLANMNYNEIDWVSKLLITEFQHQAIDDEKKIKFQEYLARTIDQSDSSNNIVSNTFKQKLMYRKMITNGALESLGKFTTVEEKFGFKELINLREKELQTFLKNYVTLEEKADFSKVFDTPSTDLEIEAAGIIPKRIWKGPVDIALSFPDFEREDWQKYRQFRHKHGSLKTKVALACYWIDDNRSIFEISKLLEYERGWRILPMLLDYFKLLEDYGLIGLKKNSHFLDTNIIERGCAPVDNGDY